MIMSYLQQFKSICSKDCINCFLILINQILTSYYKCYFYLSVKMHDGFNNKMNTASLIELSYDNFGFCYFLLVVDALFTSSF